MIKYSLTGLSIKTKSSKVMLSPNNILYIILLKQVFIVRLSNKALAIIFPMKNIMSNVSIEALINLLNLNEYSSESDFSNNSFF